MLSVKAAIMYWVLSRMKENTLVRTAKNTVEMSIKTKTRIKICWVVLKLNICSRASLLSVKRLGADVEECVSRDVCGIWRDPGF